MSGVSQAVTKKTDMKEAGKYDLQNEKKLKILRQNGDDKKQVQLSYKR